MKHYKDPHKQYEVTYTSYWILAFSVLLQFLFYFFYGVMKNTEPQLWENTVLYEYLVGIGYMAALFFAGIEDFRYGTKHVKGVIILTLLTNYCIRFLATASIWLIIAGLAAFFVFSSTSGLFFSASFLVAGGSIGTLALIFFCVGAIISLLIGLGGLW